MDAMGGLNVPVVEALLNYNRIPEEIRPSLFRHILTICDELGRPKKDGQQNPTHH